MDLRKHELAQRWELVGVDNAGSETARHKQGKRLIWMYTQVFDQLYYVSDVVIAKSDKCISTYLFDQLYYVSDVVIAKSDE
ncbi:BZ3500_MvSof-1268-A1-R1_C038g00054 [Microbotryum saponariae]|uniref:BZ3500_MvSof-1268-A1-R1_C038g00054 protein n=1 Tax=Microbotryum saponariae TaxID=289078 RepID=A0A2X0LSD1_9BASI|nr:BZ3500_MvSof-1268-A1-R1_C038g00054 [Microbotryum saponariae]